MNEDEARSQIVTRRAPKPTPGSFPAPRHPSGSVSADMISLGAKRALTSPFEVARASQAGPRGHCTTTPPWTGAGGSCPEALKAFDCPGSDGSDVSGQGESLCLGSSSGGGAGAA